MSDSTPTPSNRPLITEAAKNRFNQYFGQGEKKFSLFSGQSNKYEIDSETKVVHWKGISGILQWFYRWPFGIGAMKDKHFWVKMNQIFWNFLIFVLFYGLIYRSMIVGGSIKVPDGIKHQTDDTYLQGIYFAIVVLSTLGLGDIVPETFFGQLVVTSQIIFIGLFNFIWVIKYDVAKKD